MKILWYFTAKFNDFFLEMRERFFKNNKVLKKNEGCTLFQDGGVFYNRTYMEKCNRNGDDWLIGCEKFYQEILK